MEEPWEVCITLDFLVESSSDLCGYFKKGKEVEETPIFVVTSTTRTQELLCGVVEPRYKSVSCVFVVVIASDYLYLFLSLELYFRVWTRSMVWRHYDVKGVTQYLHQTTTKWGCKIIYQ